MLTTYESLIELYEISFFGIILFMVEKNVRFLHQFYKLLIWLCLSTVPVSFFF